jgi:two-component system sensor histidine kinase QseC
MKSIRRQLTFALLSFSVALQGAGLLALLLVARRGTIAEFDDALLAKALAVSELIVEGPEGLRTDMAAFFLGVGDVGNVEPTGIGTDSESYRRFLNEFRRNGRHNYFELWDANGRRIARSDTLLKVDLPHKVGLADVPVIWDLTAIHDEPGRAIGFTFRPHRIGANGLDTRSPNEVQLVVAAEREALDEKLLRLEILTASCGILLLGATLWIIPRVLRRGLEPLDRLGEDVARIDAGSLGARFPVADAPAELHKIIDRLNGLMARLEQSFERERRFSADVAHELRTPLAELRGLAECALKWPETRDHSTDCDMLSIAHHMETMVTHMLALARGDQGLLEVHLELVELEVLVRSVWRGFAVRAEERKLRIMSQFAPMTALADPVLLRAILNIVLENAIDYAPLGGEINLAIQAEGESAIVQIANLAAELEVEDVGKLFDRFWRKEAARSGGLHLGLGLSLARTYAAAMGWNISATIDEKHRLTLTLSTIPKTQP